MLILAILQIKFSAALTALVTVDITALHMYNTMQIKELSSAKDLVPFSHVYYVVAVVGTPGGITQAVIRSLSSAIVGADEQGRLSK